MRRIRQLGSIWSWLPAFRVVAETEHLPTAAAQIGVSAQALSRTIKLLEAELGVELFVRSGRRIQLSADGRSFLEYIRTAMRMVDEGVAGVTNKHTLGSVRVFALAHHAWLLVMPVIEELRRTEPWLAPHVLAPEGADISDCLRRGVFDIAIEEQVVPTSGLEVELLVELDYSIFCGACHPLYGCRSVSSEVLLAAPFVVPPEGVTDGWPPERERTIGIRVTSFQLALELCLSGQYLAMFPNAVVSVERSGRPLRRLPTDIGRARPLYMSYRTSLVEHQTIDRVCEALRTAAKQLASPG